MIRREVKLEAKESSDVIADVDFANIVLYLQSYHR